jgi:predicted transcriptional regulator
MADVQHTLDSAAGNAATISGQILETIQLASAPIISIENNKDIRDHWLKEGVAALDDHQPLRGVGGGTKKHNDSDIKLGKCGRAVLSVLAQYDDVGCGKKKLALLAGYSWNSTLTNVLGELRAAGYMIGSNQEFMMITRKGLAVLGDYTPLPEGQGLRDYWLGRLGKCGRAVLVALFDYPDGLDKDSLCKMTGYQWNSTLTNVLGELRTAGLMYGNNSGTMKPSEHLMERPR